MILVLGEITSIECLSLILYITYEYMIASYLLKESFLKHVVTFGEKSRSKITKKMGKKNQTFFVHMVIHSYHI